MPGFPPVIQRFPGLTQRVVGLHQSSIQPVVTGLKLARYLPLGTNQCLFGYRPEVCPEPGYSPNQMKKQLNIYRHNYCE